MPEAPQVPALGENHQGEDRGHPRQRAEVLEVGPSLKEGMGSRFERLPQRRQPPQLLELEANVSMAGESRRTGKPMLRCASS